MEKFQWESLNPDALVQYSANIPLFQHHCFAYLLVCADFFRSYANYALQYYVVVALLTGFSHMINLLNFQRGDAMKVGEKNTYLILFTS